MKNKNTIHFTQRKNMKLPEYGINIQQMVEYAVAIKDRQERTQCAYSIINLMGKMFPYLRDIDDFKFKLWDNLALMANYKLDIDYPFEIKKQDSLMQQHKKISYKNYKIKYLHYGNTIQRYIKEANKIEDKTKREAFINVLYNYMKRCLLVWNKEIADDRKVIEDINKLSEGKLSIDENSKFITMNEHMHPKQNMEQKTTNNKHNKSKNKNKNKNKNNGKRNNYTPITRL
jgi:hypothetical protein